MTDETTTEQLAEIEGQAQYILPAGWQKVPLGEPLKGGDEYHEGLDRYIRRIEPQPQPDIRPIEPDKTQELPDKTQELPDKTQELPDKTRELPEYTPPEGWRVLAVGEVLQPGDHWVNWEGTVSRPDIQHGDGATVSGGRYIRWVKPQPQPEPQAAAIEELRSEVSYVQNLLGTEKRRVTELEELVASLRTINEGAEKAVSGAGVVNDSLRLQLAAVKAELASVAADRQKLRVELDAAQQVPADSPELRQLRADLAEVTQDRDQYLDSYQRIFGDLETIRGTTKAETVEAIAEWLEPVQAAIAAADNVAESTRAGWLAKEVIQHLPSIMRSLAGLNTPEDVD